MILVLGYPNIWLAQTFSRSIFTIKERERERERERIKVSIDIGMTPQECSVFLAQIYI